MFTLVLLLLSAGPIKEKEISSTKPAIIMFTAKWCAPCGRMKKETILPLLPLLKRLFVVRMVDVDEDKETVQSFKKASAWDGSIPHLVLISEDNVLKKESTGYKDIGQFVNWISEEN